MTRLEEIALVARCVGFDDRRAFARLVDEYHQPLLRFLTGMSGDEILAADLAQETFIKAWRGLRSWVGSGRFSTWLFAIALNEFRSHVRSCHMEVSTDEIPEAGSEPLQGIDARMDLNAALRYLSETQRAVVLLFYYRDLPIKKIAAITDMPENTVKSHLQRARTVLKQILQHP